MPIRCRSEGARALVLLLALGLAGCKPLSLGAGAEPEPAASLEPVGEAREALEKSACEARHGQWTQRGSGGFFCATRPADGGKSCRTGDDCIGACLARSMSCAPIAPLVGCNEIITGSGLRVTECVE